MDEKNWLLGLKEKSCGSDLTEADEPSIDFDVADDFEENMYEPESGFENTDDFSGFDGFKYSYDFENAGGSYPDDFADFEGEDLLFPAAVQKQDLSFRESLKHFSYPKWLKSVLPQYFKPTLWMTALFVTMIVAGYSICHFYPEIFDSIFSSIDLPDGDSFELILFIFFNNSRVLFMLVFFGFIFSIVPVLIIIANGFLIGIVSEASIHNLGPAFLLTGLLPHGIIEIPVILFGAGIGFQMGVRFTRLLLNQILGRSGVGSITAAQFKKDFRNVAGIYFLFLLPLLLAAAIIEVCVTGSLLGIFF